jgi:hypothetical protein
MSKKKKDPSLNNLHLRASADEVDAYRTLATGLRTTLIPSGEILANVSLFLTRSSLSHVLFLDEFYRRILETPGQIFEFGVRWGRTLATFHGLWTIYDPYNMVRQIVGFDTFSGFPNTAAEEGDHAIIHRGALRVSRNYEDELSLLLDAHQRLGPSGHLRRYELFKGDVTRTVSHHLRAHPEALVALAYFDLDLYRPTRTFLRALKLRLTQGIVLVFDELGFLKFPRETTAVLDELGVGVIRLKRDPRCAHQAFAVIT